MYKSVLRSKGQSFLIDDKRNVCNLSRPKFQSISKNVPVSTIIIFVICIFMRNKILKCTYSIYSFYLIIIQQLFAFINLT